MTTRHYTRLLIGTATVALIAGLLFNGSACSAAVSRADRTAPTAPTNLVAGTITTNSVALSWNASNDSSGKWTYKVRITNLKNSAYNTLATVSQTQTTYTAKSLATNSPYTFAVYAVDAAGNKSGESNAAQSQHAR